MQDFLTLWLYCPYSKYAVMLLGPERFCSNQPDRLLGREVAYARLLRHCGYIVPIVSSIDSDVAGSREFLL